MKKTVVFLAICFSLFSGHGYGATKYVDLSWAEFYAGSFCGSSNLRWYAAVTDSFKYIPIHFPEQSGTVSSLNAVLGDLSNLYTLKVKLFRITLSTGAKGLVFQIITGANYTVAKKDLTTSILKTPGAASFDNSTYGWVLVVEGDNSGPSPDLMKFFSARITYDAV